MTGRTSAAVPLVDLHTHLPLDVAGRTDEIRAAAHSRMSANAVAATLVMPLAGLYGAVASDNDAVLAVCAGDDRLVPACTVDPHDPDALRELDRCAAAGARLVKLHPWLQGFSPLEDAAIAVARRAAAHGMPLIVHDGTPPYASPMQIGELAGRVPESTVVLAHGGLMDLWQDAVAAVLRWPNVMVTLCGSAPRAVLRCVLDRVPADRVGVGTDAGFGDPDLTRHRLETLRRLVTDLPDATSDAVRVGNGTRWLGLPVEVTATVPA